jgi:CheY-like chemotaxis protein
LKEKRILVVEDVELNQYLARHIMESWGCVVEIAENGRLAVDRITETDFDLVLMDIQMPVMDGMEATKMIRSMKDEKKSNIPIVALTANALKGDCEAYREIGMNDCLAKPFEEPILYKTISKNIRKEMLNTSYGVEEKIVKERGKASEEKLYHLAMVESISGGDKLFIEKMLKLFLDTVPVSLEDMRATVVNGDWLMLSKQAHKLKSTIDMMGIKDLKKDIRKIEIDGKSATHTDGLGVLVNKVIEHMYQVIAQVKGDHGL